MASGEIDAGVRRLFPTQAGIQWRRCGLASRPVHAPLPSGRPSTSSYRSNERPCRLVTKKMRAARDMPTVVGSRRLGREVECRAMELRAQAARRSTELVPFLVGRHAVERSEPRGGGDRAARACSGPGRRCAPVTFLRPATAGDPRHPEKTRARCAPVTFLRPATAGDPRHPEKTRAALRPGYFPTACNPQPAGQA